jgi:CRP-like cAMP-binding protein
VRAERTRNRVLQALAAADPATFARLYEELEPMALERGAVLGAPRSHADSSYFIESGIVSLVAATSNGSSIEVGIVGREGMAAISDALGHEPLPYRLVVQLPGLAYRVPKEVIRAHMLSCNTLHGLLMDYSQRMMHQLAQSAVCNRFHTSVQRLSRWLLLTAERAETNRFELTHEFVAQMVGAPRSAVSEAAATLRARGIIDYRRGVLTIRNSRRLRAIACECFEAVSQPLDPAEPSGSPVPKDQPGSGKARPRTRRKG